MEILALILLNKLKKNQYFKKGFFFLILQFKIFKHKQDQTVDSLYNLLIKQIKCAAYSTKLYLSVAPGVG